MYPVRWNARITVRHQENLLKDDSSRGCAVPSRMPGALECTNCRQSGGNRESELLEIASGRTHE